MENEGQQRDTQGRFLPGNSVSKGNPHAGKVALWRAAMSETITREDVIEVVGVLVREAKKGRSLAVQEFLNRTCGKPTETVNLKGAVPGIIVRFADETGEADNA